MCTISQLLSTLVFCEDLLNFLRVVTQSCSVSGSVQNFANLRDGGRREGGGGFLLGRGAYCRN